MLVGHQVIILSEVGKIMTKKSIVHYRIRRYFGYGYACNGAVGKGNPKKMTPFYALITCKNCKRYHYYDQR